MTSVADPNTGPGPRRFPFRFEGPWRWAVLPFAVTPGRAWAELDGERVRVRFGPWHVQIPVADIRRYEIQGPYRWWRALGVRMTLGVWDLSFCSSARDGVYLELARPIRAYGLERPAFTFTPADPDGFAAALRGRGIEGADVRRSTAS